MNRPQENVRVLIKEYVHPQISDAITLHQIIKNAGETYQIG